MSERLESVELGSHELAPGQVHRVTAHREDRAAIMDGSEHPFVIDTVHESRAGGPTLEVHPGRGVAGLTIDDAVALGEDPLELGPFQLIGGSEPSIRFPLANVAPVAIGGREIPTGATLDSLVEMVGPCERQANRGATLYRCAGITLVGGGPVPDANIAIVVTGPSAPPTTAASTGECSERSDCASCLAQAECNWTGGRCARACLMDTDCFGPGNPSAPNCPAE
ncbi:MAG: hypothetical protein AB8I08_13335 [Sandaracinaceae bacterium]